MSLDVWERRPIPTWPHPPVRSERGQELGFPLHRSIATRIYMQSNSMQVPGRIYLDQLWNLLIFQFVYWKNYASQTTSHPNWQSAHPPALTDHQFSMASNSAYEIKTLLIINLMICYYTCALINYPSQIFHTMHLKWELRSPKLAIGTRDLSPYRGIS